MKAAVQGLKTSGRIMTGTGYQAAQVEDFDQVGHRWKSPSLSVAIGARGNAGTRSEYHDVRVHMCRQAQGNEVFLCNLVRHNSPYLARIREKKEGVWGLFRFPSFRLSFATRKIASGPNTCYPVAYAPTRSNVNSPST